MIRVQQGLESTTSLLEINILEYFNFNPDIGRINAQFYLYLCSEKMFYFQSILFPSTESKDGDKGPSFFD